MKEVKEMKEVIERKDQDPKTEIRPARESDWEDIYALNQQFALPLPHFRWVTEEWIKAQIETEHYYTVSQGDEILGAMCVICEDGMMRIETLAVKPGHHDKGLGKQLIGFAKQLALEQNISSIRVFTFFDYGVEAFYWACGFRSDAQSIGYFEGKPYWNLIWKCDETNNK